MPLAGVLFFMRLQRKFHFYAAQYKQLTLRYHATHNSMNLRLLLLSCFLGCIALSAGAQTITTVAGTGGHGYSGDGGPASSAQLNHPFGIALDTAGNLFIADRFNNCIRKVNAAGIISTFAGTGAAGYNGDGIAATAAQLNNATGVFADKVGNLYIADRSNNRIRKVDNSGIITTVAGNGAAAFTGDGGAATNAALNSPRKVVADTLGNLYIADQANNRIRKVSATGIISAVAGVASAGYNGDGIAATNAQLNGPYDVAVDRLGNVYVADVDNYRIRKIDLSGVITTVVGSGVQGFSGDAGQATAARLNEANGIAIDNYGGIFIADGWNERIRYVQPSGFINTLAGTGATGFNGDGIPATMAMLNNPYHVTLNRNGELFVADYDNSRIRKITNPLHATAITIADMQVDIYPNPSHGKFALLVNGSNGHAVAGRIVNVLGQVLCCFRGRVGEVISLDIAGVNGVYFIEVEVAGTFISKALLVAN